MGGGDGGRPVVDDGVGGFRHTRRIANGEPSPRTGQSSADGSREQVTGSLERVRAPDEEGTRALAAVRDPSFPIALRGYEREAVDSYVARVGRVVDQLEATRSPDAAIRRALDEVGEETSGILQQARETASEITARSRAQADDRVREAEREARELVADAEARVRELDADFARVWDERDRLLDEVRALAERLLATADDAEERWEAQEDEATAGETAALPAVSDLAEGEGEETEAAAEGGVPPQGVAGVEPAEDDAVAIEPPESGLPYPEENPFEPPGHEPTGGPIEASAPLSGEGADPAPSASDGERAREGSGWR